MGEIGQECAGVIMDVWYGQYVDDWGSFFFDNELFDVKYIDVDGNSIVIVMDIVVISEFYGCIYNMVLFVMLYVFYEFILEGLLFVNFGDFVEFIIFIGMLDIFVEDIYGFVFLFNYNLDVIQLGSVQVCWDNNNFLVYDLLVFYMDYNNLEGLFEVGYI